MPRTRRIEEIYADNAPEVWDDIQRLADEAGTSKSAYVTAVLRKHIAAKKRSAKK